MCRFDFFALMRALCDRGGACAADGSGAQHRRGLGGGAEPPDFFEKWACLKPLRAILAPKTSENMKLLFLGKN